MKLRLDINLPQSAAFYTTDRTFDVVVDNDACGTFTNPADGTEFTLTATTGAAATIFNNCPQSHIASIETISEAAMRFHRSGQTMSMTYVDYAATLFMTRYFFGHCFSISQSNSIEFAKPSETPFHSEVLAAQSEQFAYGLACHFAAKWLGIPVDRFFFVTAAGARADFKARITTTELRAAGAGIGALAPGGFIIELEVKARSGWASFRTDGRQGITLLKNLFDKASTRPGRAFLGIIIALPSKRGTPRTRGKIVVADPGEAVPLANNEQTILLLEQAIDLLLQHGLWPTLVSAIAWLRELRELREPEQELYTEYNRNNDAHPARQYNIVAIEHEGRTFNGRIFNDALVRLGTAGRRLMSEDEARERLRLDDLGHAWYSGVDRDYINIIIEHNAEELRQFGVRGIDVGRDLSGRSAFYMTEEPMTDDLRASVRNALSDALERW